MNTNAPGILRLTLNREWFDAIAAGEKRTEFRERKPHWISRIEDRQFDRICFRNGYAKQAPEMEVECLGVRKIQKSGVPYYAIELGRVLKKP